MTLGQAKVTLVVLALKWLLAAIVVTSWLRHPGAAVTSVATHRTEYHGQLEGASGPDAYIARLSTSGSPFRTFHSKLDDLTELEGLNH